MSQLRLFKITQDELEQQALLITTLDGEIIALKEQLKAARQKKNETSEALECKDIEGQIKDSIDRLAKAQAALRAAEVGE
jgi:hypothetical protein